MKTVIWKGRTIPAEIAQVAAGADAGARKLTVRCDDCNTTFRLCDSDATDYCQDCFDIAGLENQISDGDESPETAAALVEAQTHQDERRARNPNAEQLAALATLAQVYGAGWKDYLHGLWANGYRDVQYHPQLGKITHLLQQVRNQFGPSWLAKFKQQ